MVTSSSQLYQFAFRLHIYNIYSNQLHFSDSDLGKQQHKLRTSNHLSSARSKSRCGLFAKTPPVSVGSLVYIKCDGNKHKARERYIITSLHSDYVTAKKLTGTQFRSRQYQLKLTEIYPVPGSCLDGNLHSNDPYGSSSGDEDFETLETLPPDNVLEHNENNADIIPNAIEETLPTDLDTHQDDSLSSVDTIPHHSDHSDEGLKDTDSVRPPGTRLRHPPQWMDSDVWDLSHAFDKNKDRP